MNQSGLDLVVISSRHDSHAGLVIEGLKQRKAVFVEKPLATTREQLDAVRAAYEDQSLQGEQPFLMIGFNRRFAPFTEQLRNFFAQRTEPMAINIRVNAGFIPPAHWTQQAEGAGRIVGEFCHFIDWARFIVGHPISQTAAAALPDGGKYQRDNVSTLLTFADGSIATLSYLANGNKNLPKEYFEVFCGGRVAQLDDFKQLTLFQGQNAKRLRSRQDKGHRRELALTVEALLSHQPSPIPFHEIVEVTQTAFALQETIAAGSTSPQTNQAVAV
jgi:predicted dehydrogenase